MAANSSDQGLNITAIESARLDSAALQSALSNENDVRELAALCLIAGRQQDAGCIDALWQQMDDDTLAARCAAWAMGQLDCQSYIEAHAGDAGLDQREQAWHSLAYLVARGSHNDGLEAYLIKQVDAELQRVSDGKTGLGEHVCRVLAMLGSGSAEAAVKRVISEDQYCDRFELQRLRKAIENDGRDQESLEDYARPWPDIFADDCAAVTDEAADGQPDNTAPTAAPEDTAAQEAEVVSDDADGADAEGQPPIDIVPIDWETFLSSPEAASLDDQARQVISQMGPMFEQLSAQALQKNLAELNSQELMVLVLQVLPQAIPPEYMQAALSPPAINGMQLLARWLRTTGIAAQGEELERGVRQIRETIIQQIRASGSLNSSEYDEPAYLQTTDNDDAS